MFYCSKLQNEETILRNTLSMPIFGFSGCWGRMTVWDQCGQHSEALFPTKQTTAATTKNPVKPSRSSLLWEPTWLALSKFRNIFLLFMISLLMSHLFLHLWVWVPSSVDCIRISMNCREFSVPDCFANEGEDSCDGCIHVWDFNTDKGYCLVFCPLLASLFLWRLRSPALASLRGLGLLLIALYFSSSTSSACYWAVTTSSNV